MPATQAQLDAILGSATTGGTASTGTITFSGNVANDETVTVNGVVFTAKASPTGEVQFASGTLTAAATSLVAKLNACTNPLVQLASYTRSAGVITVTYGTVGVAGDAFTLAEAVANGTVSGANLTGGVAGTGNYDPAIVVAAARMDSPFERSMLAVISAVCGIVELSTDPSVDKDKAVRQRRVLKDVLIKLAADVPIVANTTDDRATVSSFVSEKALKKLAAINTESTL